MRIDEVRAWRDALLADLPNAPQTGLSPEGLELVLRDALGALTNEALEHAMAEPGTPWSRATFIAARTVVTAPLEWVALLLARGSVVRWKAPASAPGLSGWAAAHARALGLPLTATTDRPEPRPSDLVIAMGSDETVAALKRRGHPHLLGFGHRFSAGWWSRDAPLEDTASALARDLAAHDGRGCMTPAVVFTDVAAELATQALANAMALAEARWPRGHLAPGEHAALRSRIALARAAGGAVRTGGPWSVLTVPIALARAAALPRSIQVVEANRTDTRAWLHASPHPVSTLGATEQTGWDLTDARICEPGAMQCPPLIREHDGVSLVRATRQP